MDSTSHVAGIEIFARKNGGAKRLEPATSCVTGKRSNQLNYFPKTD